MFKFMLMQSNIVPVPVQNFNQHVVAYTTKTRW